MAYHSKLTLSISFGCFFSLCKPCCFSHLFVLLNVTRHFTWWNRNSIEKYVPKNLAWNIQPLNKYTNAPSLTDDSRTFILFHSFSIHLSRSLSYFSHSHSQSISIYNDLSDIHAIAILYCDFFCCSTNSEQLKCKINIGSVDVIDICTEYNRAESVMMHLAWEYRVF